MKRYYNPERETMPREKIRQLQEELFPERVRYVYENSPLYRELYQEAKITPMKGFFYYGNHRTTHLLCIYQKRWRDLR